jgi:hypothetical protein
MLRPTERHHPSFREMHAVESGCGRFSAEEVRRLVPQDLRKLGCPETVFLRVLESRAQVEKRGSNYLPTATELRERAKEVARIIALDAVKEQEPPVPYNPHVCWE